MGVLFGLTLSEAEALVIALGSRFDEAAVSYIWAEVENQYRDQADDPDGPWARLPTDFDPVPFIERLRRLRPFEAIAVLDAVERYWVLHARHRDDQGYTPTDIESALLVESGLLSEKQLERGLEAREHERKEMASGRIVVRDFLGGLRTKSRDDDE